MNQYEEDIVYDYIINGVSQRRLASREGCTEEEIKYLIQDLGFNKTNDGKWAGDDFGTWGRLKRAGFDEEEIRGFISDYSDRYANSRKDFKSYLEKELQVLDAYSLPANCVERWRYSHSTDIQHVTVSNTKHGNSPDSDSDFSKKHKSKKKVSLASELFSLVCLILLIYFLIKFGKYILIVFGIVLLLCIIYAIISTIGRG